MTNTAKRFRVIDCAWNRANLQDAWIGRTFATAPSYAAVIIEDASVRREAWQFFCEHAGYSMPPGRAACALDLARAESRAADLGIAFKWQDDTDADTSWLEQDEFARDLESWRNGEMTCEYATAVLDGEVLASLGGIFGADANYRRVVCAELASEALDNLTNEED